MASFTLWCAIALAGQPVDTGDTGGADTASDTGTAPVADTGVEEDTDVPADSDTEEVATTDTGGGTTETTSWITAAGLSGETGGFGCATAPGVGWTGLFLLPLVIRRRRNG